MRVELEGVAEFERELREIDKRIKGSKKSVMEAIANRFAESIRGRLRSGVSPQLTATSLQLRGGGTTPLVGGSGPIGKHGSGYGTLLGSVRAQAGERQAAAVVDKFTARFHQFGFRSSEKSAIPDKDVPARPFVLISKQDEAWALSLIADRIFGTLEGNGTLANAA